MSRFLRVMTGKWTKSAILANIGNRRHSFDGAPPWFPHPGKRLEVTNSDCGFVRTPLHCRAVCLIPDFQGAL
jgi:hypothetical protein